MRNTKKALSIAIMMLLMAGVIGGGSPEHLQEAWIIPACDGCIVMTGHNGLDSADFFGAYYRYIANSIVVVDGN